MLHDPQAAEDAVQEASRKLGRMHDQGRLLPWFLGVVANKCRNARRKKWVLGTDAVGGPAMPQRAELSLNASQAEAGIDNHGTRHPFVWNFTAAVPKSWSGSSGWQIDGSDFSEVFVSC